MKYPVVDANVFIRAITFDNENMGNAARRLFRKIQSGVLVVQTTDLIISEVVYVLTSKSLYQYSREQAAKSIIVFVCLENIIVENKLELIETLELFAQTKLDFSDCKLIIHAKHSQSQIISFDKDFDHFPEIVRVNPEQV